MSNDSENSSTPAAEASAAKESHKSRKAKPGKKPGRAKKPAASRVDFVRRPTWFCRYLKKGPRPPIGLSLNRFCLVRL